MRWSLKVHIDTGFWDGHGVLLIALRGGEARLSS